MSSNPLKDARKTVDRAVEQEKESEERRTQGHATRMAVKRVAATRRDTALGRFVFQNGLALAALGFFLVFIPGAGADRTRRL
jgi:hypothetical protein